MNEIRQVKIGAILSYVILFVSNIISLVYTPFLLRSLGQSEYGLYSLMANFVAYLNLLDLGLGNAMIVYMSKSSVMDDEQTKAKNIGSFLKIYLFLGIIVILVGILLFFLIDPIFSSKMTLLELGKAKIMYLILLVPMILSFPLGVFNSIITVQEKYVFQKILNLIRVIIVPLIMIPLLLGGFKSIALVLVSSIASILTYLVNFIYCKNKLKVKILFDKIDKNLFKEIFTYSIFIFIIMIVDKINSSLDYLLLGSMCGTVIVSIYSIGAQFNNIYTSFSTSISSVMLPRISKMVSQKVDNEEISNIFIKVGRIQFLILSLILTGFLLFGKEFIQIWAGAEYTKSYYIALILMTPFTVNLIQNLGLTILQAKNLYKFRSICYSIIAVINLILSVYLIKCIGVIGAAIGTAIASIIGDIIIMNIYYAKKCKLDIVKFWKSIFNIAIYLIIPVMFGIFLNKAYIGTSYVLIFSKIAIYSIIFSLTVWLFAMNEYEKSVITKFFRKIIKRKI